jgi:hypothetical protein
MARVAATPEHAEMLMNMAETWDMLAESRAKQLAILDSEFSSLLAKPESSG